MSPYPTPPHYALCHTAARIPLGITASSSCLLEGSSSTVIMSWSCLGAAWGHQGVLSSCSGTVASVLAAGNCRGASTLWHPPPTLCAPTSTAGMWKSRGPATASELPVPEQPEASGLPRGLLLPWPLKCQPRGISAGSFKWETNLSCDLGKDNQSQRGLHLLPKQGLPAAKAFDSPAPPCFLQRESANLALTFTEISEFSIQGRKGRW